MLLMRGYFLKYQYTCIAYPNKPFIPALVFMHYLSYDIIKRRLSLLMYKKRKEKKQNKTNQCNFIQTCTGTCMINIIYGMTCVRYAMDRNVTN